MASSRWAFVTASEVKGEGRRGEAGGGEGLEASRWALRKGEIHHDSRVKKHTKVH